MLVEKLMQTDVISLKPDATVRDAIQTLAENRIRHLPIIDDEQQLLGLITDRDLKNLRAAVATNPEKVELYDTPIHLVMKTSLMTGHPMDFVEEVALIFYQNQIGCLPIISQDKLVGIVTETDLLYNYIELTGAHEPSSQIEIKVPNRIGILYEVFRVFYEFDANIVSVLVYPYDDLDEYKILAIRVNLMNPVELMEKLKEAGFDVISPIGPGMMEL